MREREGGNIKIIQLEMNKTGNGKRTRTQKRRAALGSMGGFQVSSSPQQRLDNRPPRHPAAGSPAPTRQSRQKGHPGKKSMATNGSLAGDGNGSMGLARGIDVDSPFSRLAVRWLMSRSHRGQPVDSPTAHGAPLTPAAWGPITHCLAALQCLHPQSPR